MNNQLKFKNEKNFQYILTQWLKRKGFFVIALSNTFSKVGLPDLQVLDKNGKFCFIELKFGKGLLRNNQIKFIEEISKKYNFNVFVFWDYQYEKCKQILLNYFK